MRFRLAVSGLAVLLAALGCNSDAKKDGGGVDTPKEGLTKIGTPAPDKVKIEELTPGKGETAVKGDEVWVIYTGKLTNGTVFDSNDKDSGAPFPVEIGKGEVIAGWEQGLVGMKEGGKRRLTIPPGLAYGAQSQEKIPANSTLVFDVEVLEVLKPEDQDLLEITDIKKGTGKAAAVGDRATIEYVARLLNKKEVDTSKAHGKPVTFKIGGDEVLKSVEEAVKGMQAGGVRSVRIPPRLAPPPGAAPFPPSSMLIYEIKLLKLQ